MTGTFDGDLNFGIGRECTDKNPLGYHVKLDMNPDKSTITPSFSQKLTDSVKWVNSLTIDTDNGIKGSTGLEFDFS